MSYSSKTLFTPVTEIAPCEKRLSICLRANGFSFSEVSADGVLLTFGDAEGVHSPTMTGVMTEVKAYFASVGIQPIGYSSMELVVLTDNHAWVPDELYLPAAHRQYLRLVGSDAVSILAAPCKPLASTAVFAANDTVVTAFKIALPGLVVTNQHAHVVALAPLSADHPILFAHWRKGRVDYAAFREGRYLFGNTIAYADDNEALFHTIEIVKSFALETPTTELLLCGEVDRDRYAQLRPYFPKVTLFTGHIRGFANPALKTLHTYRHALILI